MLHDIGRFEQLRRYGTFSDALSIDHAQFGTSLLFDQETGLLAEYVEVSPEEPEYHIIRKAIWNHSAFRVEEGLDERTMMFCHILRDADKVDILKVNYEIPLEIIYNTTTEEIRNAEVTEEVMKQFLECHAILRSVKKTPIDHVVGHSALVFELVYPESYRIVEEQGYLWKILALDSDNPKTRDQFEVLRGCMREFLDNMKKI